MSKARSIRSAPPLAWLERAAKDRGKAEAPQGRVRAAGEGALRWSAASVHSCSRGRGVVLSVAF